MFAYLYRAEIEVAFLSDIFYDINAMVQCQCLTAKGKPCKRKASTGSQYCSAHGTCGISSSPKKETAETWILDTEQRNFSSKIGATIKSHIMFLNRAETGKRMSNDTVSLFSEIIIGAGSDLIRKEEMYREEDKISEITIDNLIRAYRDIDDPYVLTPHNEQLMFEKLNRLMYQRLNTQGLSLYFMSFAERGATIVTSGPSAIFIDLYLDTLINQILSKAAKHAAEHASSLIKSSDVLDALE